MNFRPLYPFQCIQYFRGREIGLDDFLIAAGGPKLYIVSAKDGSKVDVWPRGTLGHAAACSESSAGGDSDEPPGKKRRLSGGHQPDSIVGNGTNGNKKVSTLNDVEEPTTWTIIPFVVVASLSPHVIAVTAEDKSLRVFEVSKNGALTQKSKRYVLVAYSLAE